MDDDEFQLIHFRGRGRGQDEIASAPTLEEIADAIEEMGGR